jgi:flavin-dependent dehydrogenase
MAMTCDAIIVGARCAGGALAPLLARSGVNTLVLDGDALPSDMPMSTHYIHQPGMDVLDELGIGDAVRKVAPASRRGFYLVETSRVHAGYPDGRAAYCVRRGTVDALVQEAATKAGATLRDRHRVVELVKDGERVTGVVAETPGGRETFHAKPSRASCSSTSRSERTTRRGSVRSRTAPSRRSRRSPRASC